MLDGELGSVDEDLGSSETANLQGCRRAWAWSVRIVLPPAPSAMSPVSAMRTLQEFSLVGRSASGQWDRFTPRARPGFCRFAFHRRSAAVLR